MLFSECRPVLAGGLSPLQEPYLWCHLWLSRTRATAVFLTLSSVLLTGNYRTHHMAQY